MKVWICLILAFCSSGISAEVLRVYNWQDYISPSVLADFERHSGITVEYKTYTTVQELEAALVDGELFDLVVPSQFQFESLLARGLLRGIDISRLVGYANLDSGLVAALAGWSRNGHYAVPYLWSTVGMVVSPQAMHSLRTDYQPSWRLLLDPAVSSRLAHCGLGWLDAPEEVFSLLLNLQGRRLNEAGRRVLAAAEDLLTSQAPDLYSLNNDAYITDLVSGQLCAAMAWSGHAITVVGQRPELQYVLPDEGSLMTIDAWAIPANARQVEAAHQFIDFMLEPANAQRNSLETHFYSPLRADVAEMHELAQLQPLLVPSASERRRLYFLESLDSEQRALLEDQWQRVKALHASGLQQ